MEPSGSVEHRLAVPGGASVGALLRVPPDAAWLYVLAHGAGAGMRHAWMEQMAEALAGCGVATLRFNFPSFEPGHAGRRPDAPAVAQGVVRAAVALAQQLAPGLPLIAGGKSFGGRMTSAAQAEQPLPGVRGLAFLGFPLHPAGKPADTRAAHLPAVRVPLLFLQGDRDALASLELLTPVVARCGGTLHVVPGADHAFAVRRSTGRTNADVQRELAQTLRAWADATLRHAP